MKYKTNQDNNFIFECVREKPFLYGFIVTTLYNGSLRINNQMKMSKKIIDMSGGGVEEEPKDKFNRDYIHRRFH